MILLLLLLIVIGTCLWVIPFFLVRTKGQSVLRVDKRARWGILMQFVAYSLLWQGRFWEKSPEWWFLVLSVTMFALASVISWTAARALGSHHRLDAAVEVTHELVKSGPYRIVRHPIYTSMLCVLLATGLLISPPVLFLIALIVFLAGTEIRIRIEDALLESQFGPDFVDYKRHVPELVPFLR